jgi:hypothetical protein
MNSVPMRKVDTLTCSWAWERAAAAFSQEKCKYRHGWSLARGFDEFAGYCVESDDVNEGGAACQGLPTLVVLQSPGGNEFRC